MQKAGLKVTAAVIAGLMAIVGFAGFDDLPRDVRARIASERSAVAGAQKQIGAARDEVSKDLSTETVLFHALPSAALYPDRFSRASAELETANRDAAELAKLEQANRRQDREQAERLLAHQRQLRTAAVADAEAVRKDAAHWIELKKHLPEEVADMERDYRAIHAVDLTVLNAAVQKAETDWPEKRADLEARAAPLREMSGKSDALWQSTDGARKSAAANDYARVDFVGLFGAADTLKTWAAELPAKSEDLKARTGQLYESWDKLLVDMDRNGGAYKQKLRVVRTRDGVAASDEKWVEVSQAQYQASERNLGMAIEHKPTGKYDAEAERVAQPAGFAYVAPYGQSNQYGHWDHHDGRDFWVFYGQYALMRDLLFGRDYRPFDRYEYEDYRTYRQRNQTYYGGGTATSSAPKYGTAGTATQEHYSGSTFSKNGGFKDSKYASKSGSYRSSEYATPGARDPNADHSGRTFGKSSSRPGDQTASPPPQRSYRPAPTPYRPSAPRSSPGRTFGSRRR